jgi:anaerobic magnesium-protoporphyrin IX monomethyl ester cyclase
MKVLLIVPNWKWCEEEVNVNYPYPPYNLCLLAAIIKPHCKAINIIDASIEDLSQEQVMNKIKEIMPDVVGTTVLMDQLCFAGHEVCRIVKEVSSTITTIMGGVYVTINSEQAIQDNNLDYVCIGEGEDVFLQFIRYQNKEIDEFPKKGLAYKDQNQFTNTGQSSFITNLDDLPIPAWNLIDFDKYNQFRAREFSPDSPRKMPYIRLYTSRGCPFKCSFCQVSAIAGNKVRRQSPKKTLDELEFVKHKYGIQSFMISDDNFLAANKEIIKELLNGIIDRKLKMPWIFEDVGVMHLDEEILRLLAASGCEYMGFAVETAVRRISKEIIAGKPLRKEHTKQMLALAKELGIFTSTNFIIGFPTETWDEIRQTISFAGELESDYTRIHILVPLKNTRIWKLCEDEGLLKQNYKHFNGKSIWKAGQIESKYYSSNDLTILKAFEWDRINFTKREKRMKIAQWLNVTEAKLLERRRMTIESIYNNIQPSK